MRVGGGDDAALRGLPEHLGQSDHWYGTRRDYIREHLPRSHGGKLVDIANDQQSSGSGHCLYERLHQHDVDHGGLKGRDKSRTDVPVLCQLAQRLHGLFWPRNSRYG